MEFCLQSSPISVSEKRISQLNRNFYSIWRIYLLFLWIGTHFGVIFNLWFGAAGAQSDDSSVFKRERYHLTTFTRRQQWFPIFLTCIDASCQVSNSCNRILSIEDMSWILKLKWIFKKFTLLWFRNKWVLPYSVLVGNFECVRIFWWWQPVHSTKSMNCSYNESHTVHRVRWVFDEVFGFSFQGMQLSWPNGMRRSHHPYQVQLMKTWIQ